MAARHTVLPQHCTDSKVFIPITYFHWKTWGGPGSIYYVLHVKMDENNAHVVLYITEVYGKGFNNHKMYILHTQSVFHMMRSICMRFFIRAETGWKLEQAISSWYRPRKSVNDLTVRDKSFLKFGGCLLQCAFQYRSRSICRIKVSK